MKATSKALDIAANKPARLARPIAEAQRGQAS